MSNRTFRVAALTRLARFFRSPLRLATAIVGVLALAAGAALSGVAGGLLTLIGAAALLATLANPVQFLWDQSLADMERRETGGVRLDPASRLRRLEEAVNLLAAWTGRLEAESENGLAQAVADATTRVDDLTGRLAAAERQGGEHEERIATLYDAVRSGMSAQTQLSGRIGQLEKAQVHDLRQALTGLAAENKKRDGRLAKVEAGQTRQRRNDNAVLAQIADLTEAMRTLRADVEARANGGAEDERGTGVSLSLLEQRVAALATTFERAALNRGDNVRLDG